MVFMKFGMEHCKSCVIAKRTIKDITYIPVRGKQLAFTTAIVPWGHVLCNFRAWSESLVVPI